MPTNFFPSHYTTRISEGLICFHAVHFDLVLEISHLFEAMVNVSGAKMMIDDDG